MKISDLLGEGWEPDEHPDPTTEPAAGYRAAAPPPSVVSVPSTVANPASVGEPEGARAPDVIASLASWAPAPEPRDPEIPAEPVSARAQLADLAAGLAIPVAADATKRKGSSRGPSRSGSRRRGR
jgi:hypothetical protein